MKQNFAVASETRGRRKGTGKRFTYQRGINQTIKNNIFKMKDMVGVKFNTMYQVMTIVDTGPYRIYSENIYEILN